MDSFLIGNVIGIVQVCIGHPFDTIKTHLQLNVPIKWTLRNLYSGTKYPIYSSCLSNAFTFGTYDIFSKKTNPIYAAMLSGAISGIIITPFETLKIKEQLKQNNGFNIHMRGLMTKGLLWTVLRETIAVPVYFESFNYLDKHCSTFIAGGGAGVICWTAVYNLDLLKTRAQSMILSKPPSQRCAIAVTLLRAFIVNGINLSIYRKYIPLDITV